MDINKTLKTKLTNSIWWSYQASENLKLDIPSKISFDQTGNIYITPPGQIKPYDGFVWCDTYEELKNYINYHRIVSLTSDALIKSIYTWLYKITNEEEIKYFHSSICYSVFPIGPAFAPIIIDNLLKEQKFEAAKRFFLIFPAWDCNRYICDVKSMEVLIHQALNLFPRVQAIQVLTYLFKSYDESLHVTLTSAICEQSLFSLDELIVLANTAHIKPLKGYINYKTQKDIFIKDLNQVILLNINAYDIYPFLNYYDYEYFEQIMTDLLNYMNRSKHLKSMGLVRISADHVFENNNYTHSYIHVICAVDCLIKESAIKTLLKRYFMVYQDMKKSNTSENWIETYTHALKLDLTLSHKIKTVDCLNKSSIKELNKI